MDFRMKQGNFDGRSARKTFGRQCPYREKTRNGNMRIAPTTLNTSSSVKPTILKGNRMSQTIGKRKSINKAMGQQRTNNKHQSAIEIKSFICSFHMPRKNAADRENQNRGTNEEALKIARCPPLRLRIIVL